MTSWLAKNPWFLTHSHSLPYAVSTSTGDIRSRVIILPHSPTHRLGDANANAHRNADDEHGHQDFDPQGLRLAQVSERAPSLGPLHAQVLLPRFRRAGAAASLARPWDVR